MLFFGLSNIEIAKPPPPPPTTHTHTPPLLGDWLTHGVLEQCHICEINDCISNITAPSCPLLCSYITVSCEKRWHCRHNLRIPPPHTHTSPLLAPSPLPQFWLSITISISLPSSSPPPLPPPPPPPTWGNSTLNKSTKKEISKHLLSSVIKLIWCNLQPPHAGRRVWRQNCKNSLHVPGASHGFLWDHFLVWLKPKLQAVGVLAYRMRVHF